MNFHLTINFKIYLILLFYVYLKKNIGYKFTNLKILKNLKYYLYFCFLIKNYNLLIIIL